MQLLIVLPIHVAVLPRYICPRRDQHTQLLSKAFTRIRHALEPAMAIGTLVQYTSSNTQVACSTAYARPRGLGCGFSLQVNCKGLGGNIGMDAIACRIEVRLFPERIAGGVVW